MQDNENQTQYVDPYTPYGCTHQRNKPNDSDKDLENLLNGYINRDSDISRILYILTKNSVGGALNLEISDLREAVAELEDIINNKANTSDIEDLDLTINNLNTAIEGLSTTVEGKANSSDLQDLNESLTNLSEQLSALSSTVAGKADASDIVAPSWGNITGTLSSQTDLKDALDGKADASDLQALNTTVDSKASTSDLQALSSVLVSLINEKADQIALDAVNTTVEGKADAPKTFTATLSASSWGTTKPFRQSVTVSGILSTDEPFTDIKLTDNATTATQELQSWGCVTDIKTSNNLISVVCLDNKPTANMTIRMRVIR